MKKYFWLLSVMLLLHSCKTKSPEQLLVGSWQFSNVKYEKEIDPDVMPIIEASLQALRETYSLEYHADGTYHSHSLKEEKGSWVLDDDAKKLTHIYEDGQQNYDVLMLTKDSLHLKTKLQDEVLTLKFSNAQK